MAEDVSTPVATEYALAFVRAHLPAGSSSVLEVGCGAGELSARLAADGLSVVAIDSDADCVAAAKTRGVDARVARWPAAIDERFDAVLFTRSLHHIHQLDAATEAAVAALHPGGRVIVDDFRAEGGSERSTAWFTGLVRTMHEAGTFAEGFDAEHKLAMLDLSAHEHELHSSRAIAEALRRAGAVAETDAAYYFRYLEADLKGSAKELLNHELSLIAAGAIDPLGKRFVLTP